MIENDCTKLISFRIDKNIYSKLSAYSDCYFNNNLSKTLNVIIKSFFVNGDTKNENL